MTKYRRARDGMLVDGSEALDANGCIRTGYGPLLAQPGEYISFDMAFADTAAAGRVMFHDTMLSDAERTFRDSPEGREAIAYARSCVNLRDSMGGTRGWTEADERAAIQGAMLQRDKNRRAVADAQTTGRALAANEAAAYGASVRDLIRANRNQ